jgi:hypothetical protein
MSKRCTAKNRNGKRCDAWPVTGATQCALHSDPERAAEVGSKHGRSVTFRPRPDVLDLPHRPLKTIEEVCELLEEAINRVRQGPFDLRAANSIGYLAAILLKALAQRVEAPETTNSEIYTSLFQRLGQAAPQQEVFALFPQPPQKDAGIAPGPLPAPGESIRPGCHVAIVSQLHMPDQCQLFLGAAGRSNGCENYQVAVWRNVWFVRWQVGDSFRSCAAILSSRRSGRYRCVGRSDPHDRSTCTVLHMWSISICLNSGRMSLSKETGIFSLPS